MTNSQYIVLSDLDGTLTETQSSWQFIMESFDLWESEGKHHLKSFLEGTIDYNEFLRLDVASWKGHSEQDYILAINKIKFRPGVKELFDFFNSSGAKIFIISSGLMDLALRARNLFPVHKIYANVIVKENGFLNGEYEKNVGWKDNLSKKAIVEKVLGNIDKNIPVIALGDTSGDYPLIESANLSFSCYSSDSGLNSIATHIIDNEQNFYSIPHIVTKFLKDIKFS